MRIQSESPKDPSTPLHMRESMQSLQSHSGQPQSSMQSTHPTDINCNPSPLPHHHGIFLPPYGPPTTNFHAGSYHTLKQRFATCHTFHTQMPHKRILILNFHISTIFHFFLASLSYCHLITMSFDETSLWLFHLRLPSCFPRQVDSTPHMWVRPS